VGHKGDQEEDNHPGEGWVRWNPSHSFTKTEVLQEDTYKWKGAKYQKFLIQNGDPKVFSTMGKGKPEYGESLHPAPSWRIFPLECKEEDLEKFLPEHYFRDQSLIRGAELINDNGIFAEVYCLQSSAIEKKYLDLEQERLSKEAQTLTNKWVELNQKRQNVELEIREAKKYLTEAQALERIREAYNNRDPKALISPGEGGDWLISMGMGQRYHLPHTPKILDNCHCHRLPRWLACMPWTGVSSTTGYHFCLISVPISSTAPICDVIVTPCRPPTCDRLICLPSRPASTGHELYYK
jgi:hypothetical protein